MHNRRPDPIEIALAIVATLPELPPVLRAALAEIVRCVSASRPGARVRLSVAHLCERMGRSDATVDRYLRVLRSEGWIDRAQDTRGARRDGWRPAWTWLTPRALEALALRGSIPGYVPKAASQGKPVRVRRIPPDLAHLAQRIGAARVVWLMARCKLAGRRLQEFATAAAAADSPAGFVLAALRPRPMTPEPPRAGGDALTPARQVLAVRDAAGTRTEAGRLAGLEMLRRARAAAC